MQGYNVPPIMFTEAEVAALFMGDEITERTVEALGLIFYSRKWHLIAWCRLRQAMRDSWLNRMKCWTVLKACFPGLWSLSTTTRSAFYPLE